MDFYKEFEKIRNNELNIVIQKRREAPLSKTKPFKDEEIERKIVEGNKIVAEMLKEHYGEQFNYRDTDKIFFKRS